MVPATMNNGCDKGLLSVGRQNSQYGDLYRRITRGRDVSVVRVSRNRTRDQARGGQVCGDEVLAYQGTGPPFLTVQSLGMEQQGDLRLFLVRFNDGEEGSGHGLGWSVVARAQMTALPPLHN